MAEEERPAGFDVDLADDAAWEAELAAGEQYSLVDLVNRVLDKGVVITGDVTISVAGVDLVYLGLNALLTSVSSLRRAQGEGGRVNG
ncbi:MAG TPA: gas vesicle protein [Longimicrobiaceae bacterium]|jgi:hypothetical protein|nr:gas vesicle protein [Longimicrobiaceae bacterium]